VVVLLVVMLVELLVYLSGGHERRGRTGTEQHCVGVGSAAVVVAVLVVIVVYVGQHCDGGRCVERVEQLYFERRLDDVEACQRRLVVERGALRRVWRVARRAGRHLGVY